MNNPTTLWIEHWEEVELIKKVMEENTLMGKVISAFKSEEGGWDVYIDFASATMPYMLGKQVELLIIKSMV